MNFDFSHLDVKQEIQTALKNALPARGYDTVKVLKADPKSASELPCVGINRADDSETSQSIGDIHGDSYDAETKLYTTEQGTFFSESLELRIWHTNADERDKLYHLVKATLFAMRRDLVAKGLLNLTLRGGRDEQDNTMQHAPDVLYWSSLTFTYLNPLDIELYETVEPITSISGQLTAQEG